MELKHINLELKEAGKILSLQLNRPKKRNAFNDELISEFQQVFDGPALSKGDSYESVRLILLHGAGKAFCAGGDLNWMKASLDLSEEDNFKDCQKLTKMFQTMDTCPNPVVGVVHGYAIGGGVGLASICDHLIAETETVFSLSEVKLGLIPACIAPFVLGKVGYSQCRSLFVSGERFKAEKAQKIGLVHEIANKDELWEVANKRIQLILEGGPRAIGVAKSLLHKLKGELANAPLQEQLGFAAGQLAQLRVSQEGQEGLRSFLEKRSPAWRA